CRQRGGPDFLEGKQPVDAELSVALPRFMTAGAVLHEERPAGGGFRGINRRKERRPLRRGELVGMRFELVQVVDPHAADERPWIEYGADAERLPDIPFHDRVRVGAPLEPAGQLHAPDVRKPDRRVSGGAVGADPAEELVAPDPKCVETAVAFGGADAE